MNLGAMNALRKLGHEKMREVNARNGAGDNQFGVKMGDLRVLTAITCSISPQYPAAPIPMNELMVCVGDRAKDEAYGMRGASCLRPISHAKAVCTNKRVVYSYSPGY